MFALANTAGCVVSFLALLIVVLCRMFSHHICLEIVRLITLVVAVSTVKRLLTSVRLHVSFYDVRLYARIITLTTLKGLLS